MRRTILLADDSPTIQRLVKQTFADADFEIVSVSNGDAAIRKFEEIRPDVVLADIYMPGKNGFEVCAYVKAHSTRSGAPVILLVGAFDVFDEEAARAAGAAADITKPFEPGALVDLVMSVLPKPNAEPNRAPEPEPIANLASPDATDVVNTAPLETTPISEPISEPIEDDLLGLEGLFKDEPVKAPPASRAAVTEADIERIAARVIQKISSQVIENIAWEIVPDITEKVLREELKKNS
jgi:CheY-like chemotaxis protein